ncbi:OLC1v1023754C1 [Oldenlandia corymbosa var. corymbosa]|uniref:OLC1v1023754C1 n=1 Tax=Oldenlandia corymbosa var. corymbosa TaxID=529605 RepID=A0AAV1C137_OLDCO|nr:OLC1v1023754C1 [Oldenlandia corymbosa var. corymbosa]
MGDLEQYSSCQAGKVHQIKAVIFDLDGTLLNSEQFTEGVVKEFLARYGKVYDMEKESKRRGMLWKETVLTTIEDYDLPLTFEQYVEGIMPLYLGTWQKTKPLPGATRLMKHLHKHGVPFGLASNAERMTIHNKVNHQGWKDYFRVILGSDQVKSGKPAPDIYLEAAKQMGVEPVYCLVIEDSLVGVRAGKAAGMNVVAVPSLLNEREKFYIADSVINSLLEFQPDVWGLPAFKDWVCNALPIEPIYVRGVHSNGLLHEHSEGGPYLPIQLQGLYFGWARRNHDQQIVKFLTSIEWEHKKSHFRKRMQACVINDNSENAPDQELELLLVGYIRGSKSDDMGKESNLEIQDEDKLIANAALDSSEYSGGSCRSFFPELAFLDNSSATE